MKIILFPLWESTEGDRVGRGSRQVDQAAIQKKRDDYGKGKWQQLMKWNQSEDCKSMLGPSTSTCWWTRLVECGETLGDVGKLIKRCRRQAGGVLVPGWASRSLFGSQGSSAVLHMDIRAPTAGNGFRAPLLFHTHVLVISGPLGRNSCR